MKTKKLSLASIKNIISRSEMRKIMAGSGPPDYSCANNICVDGNCEDDFCGCSTEEGSYSCISILA